MRIRLILLACAALSLAACSEDLTDDAGIKTAAEAAFQVDFNANQGMLGKECGSAVSNHQAGVGYTWREEIREVSLNGRNGAEISCSVVPSGAGFNISLSAKQNDNSLTLSAAGVPAAANVSMPAEGVSVTYNSSETPQAFSAEDCQLYVLPSGTQKIEAGYAHFQFQCAVVVSEDNSLGCAIGSATALMRNCVAE